MLIKNNINLRRKLKNSQELEKLQLKNQEKNKDLK